ncbi:MAG: helix-turn-helix domain-containing protein [Thermoleophilaceae bacterium]
MRTTKTPRTAAKITHVVAATRTAASQTEQPVGESPTARSACCSQYHRAVELVGKRWTGAILLVLMDGSLRFSEVKVLVPDLSDRLLSERLKELEVEGIVERHVEDGHPVKVQYSLTVKGQALEPAMRAIKAWANSHP